MPRNGAILIAGSELEMPIVEVARSEDDGTKMIFGGSITQVSGNYWAWKATEPLALGDYNVRVSSSVSISDNNVITVIDEIALDPPEMTSDPIATYVEQPSELGACMIWNGAFVELGESFPIASKGMAMVSPRLATDAPIELAHQFLLRAFAREDDDSPFQPIGPLMNAGPYEEQAEEYCFGLEALDLATLTVRRYEDALGCALHGDLPGFEEHMAAVPDALLRRQVCMTPPAGYEELWCMLIDDCTGFSGPAAIAATFCQSFAELCPDARPIQAPDGGTSASAASGGTSAGPSDSMSDSGMTAGSPQQPAEESALEEPEHTGGCSIQRANGTASNAALVLGLALSMLYAHRRTQSPACARTRG